MGQATETIMGRKTFNTVVVIMSSRSTTAENLSEGKQWYLRQANNGESRCKRCAANIDLSI